MEYLGVVFRYWKWLVIDWILAIIAAVFTFLGKPLAIGVPVTLGILFIGFTGAQVLAYRDLKKEKTKLEAELEEAKRYEIKSQLIEIISKEKYPAEILRIFDDMRRCLSIMIESSDSVQDVTSGKLFNVCKQITPHELYLAVYQKTLEDNAEMVHLFYRYFNFGIGLRDLQAKDARWKQLVEELETTKKDIPDQELVGAVNSHFSALNGVYSIRLFYRYMDKYGTTEMILKCVEPFRPVPNLLDQTMARINHRIIELKLGEPPKWEMLYIKEK